MRVDIRLIEAIAASGVLCSWACTASNALSRFVIGMFVASSCRRLARVMFHALLWFLCLEVSSCGALAVDSSSETLSSCASRRGVLCWLVPGLLF